MTLCTEFVDADFGRESEFGERRAFELKVIVEGSLLSNNKS